MRDKAARVRLRVIAGAAAAGKKVKRVKAKMTAEDAAAACKDVCDKAMVNCDDWVLCEACVSSSCRHLLAEFDTSVLIHPDVAKVDPGAHLKTAGATVEESTMDPDLSTGQGSLSAGDVNALDTETEASGAAEKEAETAETEAKAAETEVTTAEKFVSPPPPPNCDERRDWLFLRPRRGDRRRLRLAP